MTTYAAQADIENRYGSNLLLTIADPDGTGAINTGLVTLALADASEFIDSHLQERYQLPLQTIPTMLIVLAVDIAVYRIAVLPTEEQRKRYEDALKLLKSIAEGKLQLGAAPPPQTEGQTAVSLGPPRRFGRCKGRLL